MQCKHLHNGLVLMNEGYIVPCCVFTPTDEWRIPNDGISDVISFHSSAKIQNLRMQLTKNEWPKECTACQTIENSGGESWRMMSATLIDNSYSESDLFVELRPGITCNLACNTCDPDNSSRVAETWRKLNIEFIPSKYDSNQLLDHFDSISSRIKRISVLGGEPFYDKKSLKLLNKIAELPTPIIVSITTNGSCIDFNLIKKLAHHKVALTFSIDAFGPLGENIRYGSNMSSIWDNYLQATKLVETHIICTVSMYNVLHLEHYVRYLENHMPSHLHFSLVTTPNWQSVAKLPTALVKKAENQIDLAIQVIKHKFNSAHELRTVIQSLLAIKQTLGIDYQHRDLDRFLAYTTKLDSVKPTKFWELEQNWSKYFQEHLLSSPKYSTMNSIRDAYETTEYLENQYNRPYQ